MFMKRHLPIAAALAALTFSMPAVAAPSTDEDVARIIDEGMNHSQAMTTASALMDGIGPRLTNSENHRRAQTWAMEVLRSYGLQNVHQEAFDFGLGWNLTSYSATMIAPRSIPDGDPGGMVAADRRNPAGRGGDRAHHQEGQFAAWKGKLAGKIVLISPRARAPSPRTASSSG
jgi:hypothetical protein